MASRKNGRVRVELWFSGFTTVDPPRCELTEDERRWADWAYADLHPVWLRVSGCEACQRRRRQVERRAAERVHILDGVDRRRIAHETRLLVARGRLRLESQHEQLAFSYPSVARGDTTPA